jgi:hypothetical protein
LAGQQHRIGRQVLEVVVPQEPGTRVAQEAFRDAYYAYILPMLERLFDEIVPPDRLIRLDYLALDLGEIGRDFREAQILPELERIVRRQLSEAIAASSEGGSVSAWMQDGAGETEIMLFFLLTGRTPHWIAPAEFEPEIRMQRLLALPNASFADQLMDELRRPVVVRRLAWTFSEPVLQRLMERLMPMQTAALRQVQADLKMLHEGAALLPLGPQLFDLQVWEAILGLSPTIAHGDHHPPKDLFYRILGRLLPGIVFGTVDAAYLLTRAYLALAPGRLSAPVANEILVLIAKHQHAMVAAHPQLRPQLEVLSEREPTILPVAQPKAETSDEQPPSALLPFADQPSQIPTPKIPQALDVPAELEKPSLTVLPIAEPPIADRPAEKDSSAKIPLPESQVQPPQVAPKISSETTTILEHPSETESPSDSPPHIETAKTSAPVAPPNVEVPFPESEAIPVMELPDVKAKAEEQVPETESLRIQTPAESEAPRSKRPLVPEESPTEAPVPLVAETDQPVSQPALAVTEETTPQKERLLPDEGGEPSAEEMTAPLDPIKARFQRFKEMWAQHPEALIPTTKSEPLHIPWKQDEKGGFEVMYAGLILLWPYLAPLFRALEWMDKKDFVSEEARLHAVRLLHFVATGDESEPEEQSLSVCKLLAGMDPSDPVPVHLALTEAQREEADGMLQAVIANWTALRKTSPAGLRRSFLQRTGVLRFDDQGWMLHVQRETLDVLLDRIPWGFSTIRLSWLKKMIFVEW